MKQKHFILFSWVGLSTNAIREMATTFGDVHLSTFCLPSEKESTLKGNIFVLGYQHVFIPRHTILAGYYGFTLVVCESVRLSVRPSYVRPSVFRFRMITWVNINGFWPNLVYALILWRSGLGLLMGKFRQFLTESARDTPIFSFPDYNLSK